MFHFVSILTSVILQVRLNYVMQRVICGLTKKKSDLWQHFPFIFNPNANGLCNNALLQLGNGSDRIESHAQLLYSDE